jgi:hypothetical protein
VLEKEKGEKDVARPLPLTTGTEAADTATRRRTPNRLAVRNVNIIDVLVGKRRFHSRVQRRSSCFLVLVTKTTKKREGGCDIGRICEEAEDIPSTTSK